MIISWGRLRLCNSATPFAEDFHFFIVIHRRLLDKFRGRRTEFLRAVSFTLW